MVRASPEKPTASGTKKLTWDEKARLKLASVVLATATGLPTASELAEMIQEEGWGPAVITKQLWVIKNNGKEAIRNPISIDGEGGSLPSSPTKARKGGRKPAANMKRKRDDSDDDSETGGEGRAVKREKVGELKEEERSDDVFKVFY